MTDPATIAVRRDYRNGRTPRLHAVTRISPVIAGRADEAVTLCGLTMRRVAVHGLTEARWPWCTQCQGGESLVCICRAPDPTGRYGSCATCHRLIHPKPTAAEEAAP